MEYDGGLIGDVPNDKIFSSKEHVEFPDKLKKVQQLLQFPKNKNQIENDIFVFGTYNLALQPYYADIDMRNNVTFNLPRYEAIEATVLGFQYIIKKIESRKGIFFTDAKAGEYGDGDAIHWTAEEILKGNRNANVKDFNGHIGKKNLYDAIIDKPKNPLKNVLLKIDCVLPYYGKYLECTNVYSIWYIENGIKMPLNVKDFASEDEEMREIIATLINDTKKQRENKKFFKVIKRIFALTRYYKDYNTARLIEPLLLSNVSKLSTIESDLKTLELLIELNKKISKQTVGIELNNMKDRIVNILDLEIDTEGVIGDFDRLYASIKRNNKKETLQILDKLTRYIHEKCNINVVEYLQSIGFNSFRDFGTKYII